MIIEDSWIALENELSNTNITFVKQDGVLKLHFNNSSNLQQFKKRLSFLYSKFLKELSLNISHLQSDVDKDHYLEFSLQNFQLLEEKIADDPIFEFPQNEEYEKSGGEPSFIYIRPDDLRQMVFCFKQQQKIILKSIKLIKRCRFKFTSRLKKLKELDECWKDVFKDFYPHISRLKDQLSEIESIQEKIKYLKSERKRLAAEFIKKGIDLYDSPINLFFEARIDCLKDFLLTPEDKPDETSFSILNWSATITDFLELVLALDKAKIIRRNDGSPITRKELTHQLTIFLNLKPIPDLESRITKLMGRSNPTSFLDSLHHTLELILVEK